MAGRAGTRRRRWLAVIGLGMLGLAAVRAGAPEPAFACSAAPVAFDRVVERAPRIFVVTVAARFMDGGTPSAYTLVVREALRGSVPDAVDLPTVITIPAPVVTACGDVLDVGITTHLVLAMDVPAFEGTDPLAVPWILKPSGALTGGWDDGPATWVDLDAFRAALAGEAFETPAPTPDPFLGVRPGEETPLASIGILVGVLIGVIAAVAFVAWARRGSRPTYTRSDGGGNPPG